ncbi:uncharacterized protein LOC119770156 [Culex quinquefasciatus]|uniref:uncharacterized protein LOC119770156 n=1 Tax=Culex quinquefasciatus TaxID=7176 RepID=UPI0018E3CF3F|nr:uncharacterized protein LOC119770156 [Culex quinquefasciatus]
MDVSRLWTRTRSQLAAYYGAMTASDFTNSTDHFFGLDAMLAIAGARLNSTNVRIRRVWNVYRVVIYLPILVVAWNLYLNFHRQAELDKVLSCLQALVATVSLAVRTWIILWYYEPLMAVQRYVNRRRFGGHLLRSYDIRSEAFYQIRKTVIPATLFIMGIVASFLLVDLSNHHYLRLPFDFSETFPVLQTLCEKMFCLTFNGIGMRTVLVYLVVYMILTGLESEVNVISAMVADIFDSVERRVHSKLASEPGSSQRQELVRKAYFWKFAEEEFGDCIELVGEFFAIKNQVRSFLNAIFLIVYYSNVLCLSSGAVYLTQMKAVTMFSLEALGYCLWVAIECFSLTKCVSLLTEANESIAEEVYSLDWPNKLTFEDRFQVRYRSVRTIMLNMMAVAQQPLRLNCFGFFEFTQERFYELLNLAYSVFTFFKDFV